MEKEVIRVKPEHIQPGIERYKGVVDSHLTSILNNAGYEYTAYRFADNRILLVLPNEFAAFLYRNEEVMFQRLSLE